MRFSQLWPLHKRCDLCQVQCAMPNAALCHGCHQDLPWRLQQIRLDQIDIQIIFDYQWPLDRLLHLFKYQQRLDLLPFFRYALQQQPRLAVDAIVAMPCSATRLRQRGYNQAQLLAQQLSILWQVPIWPHLQRIKHQSAQQRLDRAERLSNLQDAFAVVTQHPLPERLLLVDDVLTTGSSLSSAANCLYQAGAIQIQGLIIASHHQCHATTRHDEN